MIWPISLLKRQLELYRKNNEYLSLRIELQLKDDFYNFCRKSGISVSLVINQLAVRCL